MAERVCDPSSRSGLAWTARYVTLRWVRIAIYNVSPAACFGTNVSIATASTHANDVFAVETGRWITANYSMTLATNLIATGTFSFWSSVVDLNSVLIGLVAYRIWQVKRQSRHFMNSSALSPLLRVVIESGAIYSMTVTAALITFVCKSNVVYVVLDMVHFDLPHI